jgi:hypothetical protein
MDPDPIPGRKGFFACPGAGNNERQDIVDSRNIPIRTDASASPGHETDSVEESPHFRVVDKRCFLEGDPTKPVASPVEEKHRYPTYVEELRTRLAETERRFAEKARLVDQETARTRMRLEADYERKLALSEQSLLLPFLEILDNLERAIHAAAIVDEQEMLEGAHMPLVPREAAAHAVSLSSAGSALRSQSVPGSRSVLVSDPERTASSSRRSCADIMWFLRPAQVRVGQMRQERHGRILNHLGPEPRRYWMTQLLLFQNRTTGRSVAKATGGSF